MGLAASQARLLFITSRQNDVSAKMQNISNQTMILARDSEEVSDKYNRMLTEKSYKLKNNAVSYEALMGAGALNSGEINFVTVGGNGIDGHPEYANRVVLNNSIANALGLSGTGTGDEFQKKVADAAALKEKLEPVVGSGSTTTTQNSNTNTGKAAEVTDWETKATTFKQQHGTYPTTPKSINVNDILANMGSLTCNQISNEYSGCTSGGTTKLYNRQNADDTFANLAKKTGTQSGIVELINDKEDWSYDECIKRAKVGFENLAKTIANAIGSAIGISGLADRLNPYIQEMKNGIVNDGNQMAKHSHGRNNKAYNKAEESCENGCLVAMGVDDTGTDEVRIYCNVSDLIRRLLVKTSEMYCNQSVAGSNSAASTVQKSGTMGTDKIDFESDFVYTFNDKGYGIKEYEQLAKREFTNGAYSSINWTEALNILKGKNTQGSEQNSEANGTTGDYYEAMWSKLASNGWYVDNNTSTLTTKLENGQYYLNNDVLKNNTDLYEEDTSADATAKAEAYWKTEMGKINRKEKKLEQELTKLQTEYSALTSDYESVKSIITANIGKSFTYCQNG